MRRLKQNALLIALTENKDRDVLFRENNPNQHFFQDKDNIEEIKTKKLKNK